jgi:cysteine desulfurase
VKEALVEAMELYGNPSSLHSFGRPVREQVERARTQVAEFVGASPDDVIFVGSGSEANNTVLSILSCQLIRCSCGIDGATEIVTSAIEHPCILEAVKCLGERGTTVRYVGVDEDGKVDLDEYRELVTDRTGIVSIMLANNEIGTVQDIRTLAAIAHERGALFHTDAVQAVGKIPVDVVDLGVDFLTVSGHKLYGPKGVGALVVRSGVPFCPLIRGGHQEKGRRAGTENTLGIIGFGKAIELRSQEMADEEPRLRALRERLREGIHASIPDVRFVGHPTDSLPNTLNVAFPGAEGEAIMLYLDLAGIAVSTGSACASGSLDPSHVLLAAGQPMECAHGSIRISLGRENTEQDVDYMLEVLPGVIDKIRRMSTMYGEARA